MAVCRNPRSWFGSRRISPHGGRCPPPAGRSCARPPPRRRDRKSTRLNSSHDQISYAVFCLKKKKNIQDANYTFRDKADKISKDTYDLADQVSENLSNIRERTRFKKKVFIRGTHIADKYQPC